MGVVYSLSKIVLGRWKLEFSVETEEWPEVSRGLCWDLAISILKLQPTIRLFWEPPGCWQQDYHRGRAVYINARYLTGQACHYSSIFRYWKVADAVCTQRGLQRVLLMSRPARLTPHNQEKKKKKSKKNKRPSKWNMSKPQFRDGSIVWIDCNQFSYCISALDAAGKHCDHHLALCTYQQTVITPTHLWNQSSHGSTCSAGNFSYSSPSHTAQKMQNLGK